MAKSKTDNFTKEEIELADIAKALSHPARIKILKILTSKTECITGQLVDMLPLSQSTVSQHLNELKKVGLIRGNIEGPKTCYCIDPKKIKIIKDKYTKLLTKISNCC
ncbi:MAG: metalloregulator ArsR/SmtB family transcription factor [Ignavibacteria bacterium]|jgi:DNA-binding transcriptional ArsR family regulator